MNVKIPIHCSHTEVRELAKLVEHPRNPNKHPEAQLALLGKVIATSGWRAPIVVSKRSGYIIKGHGRFQAALKAGMEFAPVDLQDYENEAAEWADMIADNRLAELAEISLPELKDLLQEMDTGAFDMDLTGFDEAALAGLMLQEHQEGEGDAEPQIDKAEELRVKWKTETGQLWQLGEHRLLCGDSTKPDDVSRVLGKDVPNLMVTDPPYGVEYDANWRNEADRANGKPYGASAIGKVENDDRADWREAWALFPGDVMYVWHAGAKSPLVAESITACGFELRNLLVWAKSNFAISRGHYHHKHEPCWYAYRKGKAAAWIGDRSQVTLWDIDKPTKSETGHSTQKPVECMARPIRNHDAEFIYEPFSGSGTTIIACEQLGRKCRAIEISPAYVAVALQRWSDATGKTPGLLNV